MQRPLFRHELDLLTFLLSINEPIYGDIVRQWIAGLGACRVCEDFSPYSLSFEGGSKGAGMKPELFTLERELIGIDEGVSVLVYAVANKTPAAYTLDGFSVDRLDGEPLQVYPRAGDSLMVMQNGKRIGGADLRAVYGESRPQRD